MSERTTAFFTEYLPQKLSNDPELAKSVGKVFQFDIKDAGTWTVDLTGAGAVTQGPHEAPHCVITANAEDWDAILKKPTTAVSMVMMGKLKVSNLGLATKLQSILG